MTPCRVTTNAASPGCYVSCGNSVNFDGTSIYFLENHSNLTWTSTNSVEMLKLTNAIKVPGPNNFMVGRMDMNGQMWLGTIVAANGINELQVSTPQGVLHFTKGFDVLTCYVQPKCRKNILKCT